MHEQAVQESSAELLDYRQYTKKLEENLKETTHWKQQNDRHLRDLQIENDE